jgi:nucleoside-diphosphate-sugar epimerase
MKNVLVLGSAGQIGLSLVQQLKKENYNVIEFDIFSNPNQDLRIENILDDILPNVDFVFFMAFDVGGSIYLKQYQNTYEFIDNNVKLMSNTFDSLKKFNSKFIFASSQMSDMSFSTYGVLKKVGEIYTNVLGGVITTFWNVYGYEPDLNKSHVITDFILMAKNLNKIDMKTDGSESRQFLYSDDCCECLINLMKTYNNIDRTKNLHVASFKWNTIAEVADIVSSEFNNCPVIKSENKDTIQKDSKYEPDPYILNFWEPRTTLVDGIKEVIKKIQINNG